MDWSSLLRRLKRRLGLQKRRSLEKSEWDNLEALIQSDPILANAFRLMEDGDVLFFHQRYSSVVALAVLSIEEIGKYLLKTWSAEDGSFLYDKRRLHQAKQGAVAALFLIDGVQRTCRERRIDFSGIGDSKKMDEFIRAVIDGLDKEKSFATAVKNKAIEYVKWSGIYYDEAIAAKGIEPSKITAENARELMEQCSKAFMIMADEKNIKLARYAMPIIYPGHKEGRY